MANVIKISDDVYEEMRKNKPEDKSMQEYASEILKAGLQNNSLITADENFEKHNKKFLLSMTVFMEITEQTIMLSSREKL